MTGMTDIECVQDYFTTVKRLLARQKLVENLVDHQEMPHHDRVKSLVQKQHLVALERLLDKLENPDIVRIYEALTNREPQIIWQMVSDTLKEGSLLEAPGSVRMKQVSRLSWRTRHDYPGI